MGFVGMPHPTSSKPLTRLGIFGIFSGCFVHRAYSIQQIATLFIWKFMMVHDKSSYINQPKQDQSSMISDKLFFGCRVWIMFFWVPIPTYTNWKKSVQIPVVAFQPSRPPWREGSRLLPKRVPAMALVCGRRSGSRVTWMPKFNDVFVVEIPWKTQRLEPERIIPIWKVTSSELNLHDFGFILFPFLPSRIHGFSGKWRDVCFQPIGSMGLVYLPDSINVGKYIPTSPMDPISGPLGGIACHWSNGRKSRSIESLPYRRLPPMNPCFGFGRVAATNSTFNPNHKNRLSNEKPVGCLGYIRDYTQLYRDYNKNMIRIPSSNNQYTLLFSSLDKTPIRVEVRWFAEWGNSPKMFGYQVWKCIIYNCIESYTLYNIYYILYIFYFLQLIYYLMYTL